MNTQYTVTKEQVRAAMEIMDRIIHNTGLAMQAAWIEWKHGRGAEAAMEWIENTLDGPGLIPFDGGTDAQAYFDQHYDSGLGSRESDR